MGKKATNKLKTFQARKESLSRLVNKFWGLLFALLFGIISISFSGSEYVEKHFLSFLITFGITFTVLLNKATSLEKEYDQLLVENEGHVPAIKKRLSHKSRFHNKI